MAYVYMVKCCDGTLYTGYAEDVSARVSRHNDGTGAKYTRSRRPVALVYAEWANDRAAAQQRENRIKALPRVRKIALCETWTSAGAHAGQKP